MPRRLKKIHVQWTTVSYSTVAAALLVITVLAAFVMYLIFPNQFRAAGNTLSDLLDKGVSKVAGDQKQIAPTGQQQAKFTAIEGEVKVMKAGSNTWVPAHPKLMLERGDVVQTSSEGLAKIVFVDGTNYTIKPDSLIKIEENSTDAAQQTKVSVQLTTGTVDLTTGTFGRGSKSQVKVSGATATLSPESAVMAKNDPRADDHQVVVRTGSAEVARGNEMVSLAANEKVTFGDNSVTMAKQVELAPPVLITPGNMAPIFSNPATPVDFNWTPIEAANAYRVRISKNPYFSSTVVDRKVNTNSMRITGMEEGAYYWVVLSVGRGGEESLESVANRFTIIPKGTEKVAVLLELDPMVQHGRVLEIKGRTEPNAKVIINNQEVPDVRSDGSFSFFTPSLSIGQNVITITAQNAKGGVRTRQETVVIR